MLPDVPACDGDAPINSMSAPSILSEPTATVCGETTIAVGTSNETAPNPNRTMKEPTHRRAWGVSCFTIQSANKDKGMVRDKPGRYANSHA
jgi:hypothetical protein